MKYYIAGPITDVPDYRKRFDAAAAFLCVPNAEDRAINPAVLPEGLSKTDYMAICLPMLMRADRVFLLPGWERSKGAQIEKALAEYCGIPVDYPTNWFCELMGEVTEN